MRRFIIATLCGVVLAACTGNQKPKQSGDSQQQTADTVSIVINSTETETAPDGPDEFSVISCEVFKFLKQNNVPDMWLDLIKDDLTADDMRDYSCWRLEPATEETRHNTNERYWARPVNGQADKLWSCYFVRRDCGGYVVIVDACSNNRETDKVTVTNAGCYYIDGKISFDIDDHGTMRNALPKPDINDFYLNADKFPKEAYDCLAKARLSYKFYINYSDNSISVTLDPYVGEPDATQKILPDPISGLENRGYVYFPTVAYHWDGDNYIIDSKHKPFEEELRFFEADGGKFAATGYRPGQLYNEYSSDLISEADLNGDGIKDLVINDKTNLEFAVYVRDNHGAYNRQLIAHRADSDGDLYASAVSDTLFVSASLESTKDYIFHYQNGDFYLLKYSQSMCWPDEGGCENYEIDFVKHTISESDDSRDTTYTVPAYPLLKLSEVPLGWVTIEHIYNGCDMIDIWRQLERLTDDASGEKNLKYQRNHVSYKIEKSDSHSTRERSVQCYEMDNGKGYKVIDIYQLATETWSGTYSLDENLITEYTYKDGKLTKNKLQKTFKPYSKDGFKTVFDDEEGYGHEGHKIVFISGDGNEDVFVWNGEEFVKQ